MAYTLLDDLNTHIELCGEIQNAIDNFEDYPYITVDQNELVFNALPSHNTEGAQIITFANDYRDELQLTIDIPCSTDWVVPSETTI